MQGVRLLLGRCLVLAGLQVLFKEPQVVCEAIRPVSLEAVALSFAKITIDWVHEDWNMQGLLDTSFGQWVFSQVSVGVGGDLTLWVLQQCDKLSACDDVACS